MPNRLVTPRETQVVELLSAGLSLKEIATVLGCSYHTVETHVKRVKQKTGLARKRIAAALLVLSVFSITLRTTNFIRVMRPVRPQIRVKKGTRRGRRENEINYLNVA